jgi:hypothetical protein
MASFRQIVLGPPERALEPASVRLPHRNLLSQIMLVNQKLEIEVRIRGERDLGGAVLRANSHVR